MKRIPTLDGWRGIAIALVLFGHVAGSGVFWQGRNIGGHGVTVFFVLSGFLITRNLISGPIDLKKFYIRRFFRLLPVVWVYLSIVIAIGYWTKTPLVRPAEIIASLLFYRNYTDLGPGGAMTGHFWSLSIEEQFYLVWPSLLLLLGTRRGRWFAGIGALGVAIFRSLMWNHYFQDGVLNFRTEVHADPLLLGCLLALLLSDRTICEHAMRHSKWLVLPAAVGFLLSVEGFQYMTIFWESVCVAVLIAAAMLNPSSIPSHILSCKPLVWLGQVSYSVYVWQEAFMWFKGSKLGFALLLIIYMPMFALGSYYLIERPCTRFGRRLTLAKLAPETGSDGDSAGSQLWDSRNAESATT